LKARALNIDSLGHVKESWLLSDLSEISLTEGLLHNDVKQGVHNGVILHFHIRDVLPADVLLGARINDDGILDVTELDIDSDSLVKVSSSEDIPTRLDIEAEDGISLLLAGLEDTLHYVGV
jgi:hypothetical protein